MKRISMSQIFLGLAALALASVQSVSADTNSGTAAVMGNLDVMPQGVEPTAVQYVLGDTSAPSPALGPYAMIPVPAGAPACTMTPAPFAGPYGGAMDVVPNDGLGRCIGSGWGSWSHGYVGDVFYTGGATSQTLLLPPNTGAVYFYVEPNPFAIQNCQASAGGTVTPVFQVDGSGGARYVGFYSDGAITSVEVACDTDFATGEYALAEVGGGCEDTFETSTGILHICSVTVNGGPRYEVDLKRTIDPGYVFKMVKATPLP